VRRIDPALDECFRKQAMRRPFPFERSLILRIDIQNVIEKAKKLFRIFAY
jgi:hypothetical protein